MTGIPVDLPVALSVSAFHHKTVYANGGKEKDGMTAV
jgi:prolyl-tRNA editing enzyme YbaK/EbsC (Cys-tRNA(Pro) deacylase)